VGSRTFVIGDIHGDLAALDSLLGKLPKPTANDTVVFLGDYVDRGPNPKGVVERVREFVKSSKHKTVTLRGNHEDKWIQSVGKPDLPFLIQWGNGCAATFRSYSGLPPLGPDEALEIPEIQKLLEVTSWFPKEVAAWMESLPLWYEDDHALYVHAGLEGEGKHWKHPSMCAEKPLLWMREPDFFKHYRGKRVVFGHTPVADLPVDRGDAGPDQVWIDHDLVGLDTGCGKGGVLSAIELPSLTIYQSQKA
jgi:serine/threonine protein phosphatase 1